MRLSMLLKDANRVLSRVPARQVGENLHIVIRDDGIGIPPEVDPDTTSSLGLKLIRNLVRSYRELLQSKAMIGEPLCKSISL